LIGRQEASGATQSPPLDTQLSTSFLVILQRQQERLLERLGHPAQESRTVGAVDGAVIVRQDSGSIRRG
jgi:hypothetical protein